MAHLLMRACRNGIFIVNKSGSNIQPVAVPTNILQSKAFLVCLLILLMGMGFTSPSRAEDPDVDSNWRFCPGTLDIPARPLISEPLESEDIHLTADEADLREGGVSTLSGNVEITKGEQQIRADNVQYDQNQDTADFHGNVDYWDEALFLRSDTAHLELNEGTGTFTNSQYRIKDNRGRGQAGELALDIGNTTDLKDVNYSTCEPEDNFWKLSADEIHLDHVAEWGKAKNVVLRIKDVPVFYSPYMSFPLSDKRKTGFLTPSVGSTNKNGFEARTPFYWNIAPNMDATITPRVLANSGLMVMGEYRYLLRRGYGELNMEYLPSDNEFDDKDRNLFGFKHEQSYGKTGELFLTYNRVSDKEYFEDFGTNISLTSTRFLERRAETSYVGSWWEASALVQSYQTVDRSIDIRSRPYRRLPQVKFNTRLPERNKRFNFGFESEFVYFDRSNEDFFVNDDSAYRLDLYPSVRFPVRGLAGFVEPKVGVHYTQYSIEDPLTFKPSPSRILPVVSLNSGIFLERDTKIFGRDYLHTLEPQLYYLYIPEDKQDNLPVFDTGFSDFSFDTLFRENRFSGIDRLGDTNQITLALTSRFINDQTGEEKGYFKLGQIYYLKDRDVTLPNGQRLDESSSPIVAELDTQIIKNWNIHSEYQWNPDSKRTEKLIAQIQYDPGDGRLLNMAYRVRRDREQLSAVNFRDVEQSDISFRWPINPKWNVVGRWNYAIPENRTIEIFGGIEYEDCCWGMRTVARRFLTDISGEFETGIFLQLELKGLAGVGKKTSEFLKRNIPGYEREF